MHRKFRSLSVPTARNTSGFDSVINFHGFLLRADSRPARQQSLPERYGALFLAFVPQAEDFACILADGKLHGIYKREGHGRDLRGNIPVCVQQLDGGRLGSPGQGNVRECKILLFLRF